MFCSRFRILMMCRLVYKRGWQLVLLVLLTQRLVLGVDLLAMDSPAMGLLKELEALSFDTDRAFLVREAYVRRSVVTIVFQRGRMVFLKPVRGTVTGLYFWGHGVILTTPPDRIERQQLSLFTGSPTLNEHFEEIFIRFTDDTFRELMDQIASQNDAEVESSRLENSLQGLIRSSKITDFRVTADLLSGRETPLFVAKILGRKLGVFDLSYDARRTEQVAIGQFKEKGAKHFYDTWCSFADPLARDAGAKPSGLRGVIDAREYRVSTQIDRSDRITGRTEVEFVAERDQVWLLTFDLSRYLKVSSIVDERDQPLLFYQNSDMTSDEEISRLGHDVVVVFLREPLREGQTQRLRFDYMGDVISRVGNGVFYVGSRGSWYPNLSTSDRARYDLTFRFPKEFTIVATGDLVREWEEGSERNSNWNSHVEIPVAGFNYGDYVKKTAKAGQVSVEIYANRGIENVYREVAARLEHLRELSLQRRQLSVPRFDPTPPDPMPILLSLSDFDTTRFTETIALQVASTLKLFEPLLGKYPYNKLAVSQIPGQFSQGWPSLLYVSSLSFLSPDQRARLGLDTDREGLFLECLQAHETAHQWWGNLIGWKSYRDLWMFEGFSNYLGFLSLKARYPTDKEFQQVMKRAKDRLLATNDEGKTLESAGALTLGVRLSSSKFPGAYQVVAYEKGAWVLHMLRYLLTDPATGSDQPFRTRLRGFLENYSNGLVSTEEFKRAIEKTMPPALDLEKNGKLDWFFDQWVNDVGIPSYSLDSSISALKSGGYIVKGKIKQREVPDTFMMPVDVFGRFDGPKTVRLGRVVVTGSETSFRFQVKTKPRAITLDENNGILCQNRTL
ncbi:MAG: M1 family aminopeptidase [Acidobacteriota bacterium]